MPATLIRLAHNPSMATDGGDRVNLTGTEIARRRKALRLSTADLAKRARLSARAVQKAEKDEAGNYTLTRLSDTLDRLEAGETVAPEVEAVRVEFRPGVWIVVDAEDSATLGDLREAEMRVRKIIDRNGA